MYSFGKRASFRRHEVDCKCNHPRVCHYTKEGHCVYQACECKEFSAKGRQPFTNIREACNLGHAHDSGLERRVCFDLAALKTAGLIRDFKPHPRLDLLGSSGATVGTYVVDFVAWYPDGTTEYVEAKGQHLVRDPLWRLKWALLQDQHKGDPLYRFRVVTG